MKQILIIAAIVLIFLTSCTPRLEPISPPDCIERSGKCMIEEECTNDPYNAIITTECNDPELVCCLSTIG
jgi:hypothetical protein